MIIVTGTGRCGTAYMARLLTSAGVECAHEGIWRLGNWPDAPELMHKLDEMPWDANASWLMAPFLEELEDVTVVHLVRHPKAVVDSYRRLAFFNPRFEDSHWPYAQFAKEHMPDVWRYGTTKMRAAAFYVAWNRMIADKAPDAILHRVEDDPEPLLDKLGISYDPDALHQREDTNHRNGQMVSDVDLTKLWDPVKSDIAALADEYGYIIEPHPPGCGTCRRPL